MGLGRLNPGCKPNPCGPCIDCLLWLDGCDLRWDCKLPGMLLLGVGGGVTIISTTQQTGTLQFPPDGTYRIWVNNQVMAELVIDGLPAGCCDFNAGLSCEERHPDLAGLRVNIYNCPFAELNGIYVLPQFPTSIFPRPRWASTRLITNGTTTITGFGGCPWQVPIRTVDVPWTYLFNCVKVSRGEIKSIDVFQRIGLRVEVGKRLYRCSQDLTVSYVYSATSWIATDESYCGLSGTIELLADVDINCNNPATDIVQVDLSQSETIGQYPQSFWEDCSWALSSCCGGVIF